MFSASKSASFVAKKGTFQVSRFFAAIALCLWPCAGFGHGGLHDSISRVTAEIAQDPANPKLHLKVAELHGLHGDWQKALDHLERVDRISHGELATDLLRGEALLQGKKDAQAKAVLDRFIAKHSDHPRAHLFRGRALKNLGDEKCLADFRFALHKTETAEPDLVIEVSKAMAEFGQLDESLRVLSLGMETLGEIPALVQEALNLEITHRRFDAALERVEKMREKNASRPEPWMARRAHLLKKAARHDEARVAWQELIDHLAKLPARERDSHAMNKFAEEARREHQIKN